MLYEIGYVGIALMVIVVLVASSFRILREYERGVVFQLGRFWKVKGPGIHCSARSTSYCPDAGVSRFPIDRIMLACEGESV